MSSDPPAQPVPLAAVPHRQFLHGLGNCSNARMMHDQEVASSLLAL
jgi:hypothetical protein